MLYTYLLYSWLFINGILPYTAVVVDATTNRPLAGVSVQSIDTEQVASRLVTDEAGRFRTASLPAALKLTMVGYAPLEIKHPADFNRPVDTIRLLPKSIVLGEVAIRPGKAALLSTFSAKGPELARQLLPGQAVAMLLLPPTQAPTGQACVLDQIHLFLFNKPSEGRLRVRLTNVLPGRETSIAAQPGSTDLLPEAAIFGPAQLGKLDRKRLVVDVSSYQLLLPPQGLCIVVECLATNPAEQLVAVTHPTTGKGRTSVVLASSPTDLTSTHTVDADEYPILAGQRGGQDYPTWSRLTATAAWKQLGAGHTNIRAEASLYTY